MRRWLKKKTLNPPQALPVVDLGLLQAASAPQQRSAPVIPPQHDHDSDAAVVAIPVREPLQINPPNDANPAPSLSTTAEGDVWFELVQQLVQAESINALVRELALQSQLIARDNDTWMLRVERESLNSTTSRERLQAALASAGHAVRLSVEVGRVIDSPAKRNAAAAAAKQEAAEALILNDPYVQSLMRDFGAKIVPGSIQPN